MSVFPSWRPTPRPGLYPAMLVAAMLAAAAVPIPVRAEDAPSFELTISPDYTFSPSTIEVPANRKVRLRVHNLGKAPEEFESFELHREHVILPGQTATIYVGPLPPGTYPFFGDFHPKTAQGKLIAK